MGMHSTADSGFTAHEMGGEHAVTNQDITVTFPGERRYTFPGSNVMEKYLNVWTPPVSFIFDLLCGGSVTIGAVSYRGFDSVKTEKVGYLIKDHETGIIYDTKGGDYTLQTIQKAHG